MMVARFLIVLVLACLGATSSTATAGVAGMDAGLSARELVRTTDSQILAEWGATGAWLRIRSLPDPSETSSYWDILSERRALEKLRARGFRPVPLVQWDNEIWSAGVRAGGGKRLPLDLREAYSRAKACGEAYGGAVTGFEFDNEPDINFVVENPETYAAFLKACYWGIRASDRAPQLKPWWQWLLTGPVLVPVFVDIGWRSRVVMAPLALPPGPFFEQLLKNGLVGYTDAFNYHFYGYAEDFPGVYRQFEEAVAGRKPESGKRNALRPESGDLRPEGGNLKAEIRDPGPSSETQVSGLSSQVSGLKSQVSPVRSQPSRARALPVLLTEYGYGELDVGLASTVEGRVRQWVWFRAVAKEIADLRIAGPMAFYLPPYLQNQAVEYGLTIAAQSAAVRPEGGDHKAVKPESGDLKPEIIDSGPSSETQVSGLKFQVSPVRSQVSGFRSGGLTFTPADFGADRPQPWMARIGRRFGDNEAAPALAWLLEESKERPYRPRDWQVPEANPSPVVIDFIAGSSLSQFKRYGGYIANGAPQEGVSRAAGELVLYNFSTDVVRGRLEAGIAIPANDREIELAPMARVLVPVQLRIPAQRFVPVEWRVRFVPVGAQSTATKAESGKRNAARPEDGNLRPEDGNLRPEDGNLRPEAGRSREAVSPAGRNGRTRGAAPERGGVGEEQRHPRCCDEQMVAPKVRPGANAEGDRSGRPLGSEGHKPEGGMGGAAPSGPLAQAGGPEAPPSTERTSLPPAVFATVLRPSTEQMVETRFLTRFDHPANSASANAALLAARPRASAEPKGETRGRWQVTKGAALSEVAPGWWRFSIDPYTSGSRRAMAELPLPDGFSFPPGALLRLRYRLLSPADTTSKTGRYLRVQLRTENGNLYSLFPWSRATAQWSEYMEAQENFTLMFYGRAALPWRFAENRPVALVLECGAGDEPVVFEIKDPRVVEIGASAR